MTRHRLNGLAFTASLFALSAVGCGGSAPPASTPPPAPTASEAPPSTTGAPAAEPKSEPGGSAEVDRAIASIKAGDFKSAKAGLEQALIKNPKNGTAAYYLGVALENLGDKQGAEQKYKEAVQLAPDIIEASINLGAIYLDANKVDEAISVTRAALVKRPDDPALHANLAVALRTKGDKEGAAAEYERAVRVVGDNGELRFAYGSLLLELGRKTQAATELKGALSAANGNRPLLASIGRALGPVGAYAECVAAFDKAIALGEDAELHVRRGLCRHSLKDEAGAKADFEAAIKLDGKLAAAHYYLGESLVAMGKNAEAAKEFDAAANLSPKNELGKKARERADLARHAKK